MLPSDVQEELANQCSLLGLMQPGAGGMVHGEATATKQPMEVPLKEGSIWPSGTIPVS